VAGAALAVPAAVCAMLAPWRASFRPVDAALILVAVVVVVASSGFRRTGLLAVASAVAAFDFFLLAPFGHFGVMSADDGETLVAWHVRPREGRPLILYFHDNGGRWPTAFRVSACLRRAGTGCSPYPIAAMAARPDRRRKQV